MSAMGLKSFLDPTGVPRCSGVYFIYEGKTLIYVGQASDLRRRLKQHLRGPRRISAFRRKIEVFRGFQTEKDITQYVSNLKFRYKTFNCSRDELLKIERSSIEKLRPEFNGRIRNSHIPKRKCAKNKKVKAKLNFTILKK